MRLWQRKTSLTLLGSFTILQFLQGIVLAGPVKRSRFAREVYPEIEPEKLEGNQAEVCIVGDVIYGADEPVPADQPCLKCKCQPPGVQCETTRCIKKPGCRAIHKPNKCCPEYQCECEHQGKLYANGERLETPPGGECRVCYCRGSEVQCADVSCYLRTDCEGSTVPGQCCPKYDHCPPKEPLVDRLTSYTTRQINVSSENDSFTTTVYDLKEVTHDHNNKLAETQTEPTLSQKTIDTQLPNETVEDYNKINVNDVVTTSTNIDELSKGVTTRRNELDKIPEQPKITIQEIIPEIKEIPITGPPKREVNLHIHQSIDEFSNKVEEKVGLFRDREDNINDLALGDTESDSSEISEIYHHPPPVLKIGDQLLFLKKGELVSGKDISTPLPVITIIGAEGLQRGTEDSSETNEDSLQVPNPNKDKDELAVIGDEDGQSNASSTPPTHVISFVKPKRTEDTTKSILSTIEYLLANLTKVEATSGDLETFDFLTTESHSVESENVTKAEHNETSSAEFDLLEAENITLGDLTTLKSADLSTLSTESDDNQTTIPILDLKVDADEIKAKKHEEVAVEQNPEYPPIPDVMSPLNLDESEHVETELPHEPKLPKQLTESTSSVPEGELIGSNSSSLDEMITTEATLESRHPLINLKAILPTSILTEVASSDFLDGASEEVNSTSNYTSEEKSKETLEETSTEDSGENTTPKGLIVSPIGDASVENYEAHEVNKKELLEVVPEVTNATIEHESSRESEKNETELKLTKDVELIDPKSLIEKFKSEEEATKRTVLAVETVTEGKRYPTDPETDTIFKQLNDELKTVAPRVLKHLTKEEEEAEIFKELLEDATSTPSSNGGDLKEAQLMEKVSTAINKFQKKETKEPLDASIMKIIKEFFTPQLKLRGN